MAQSVLSVVLGDITTVWSDGTVCGTAGVEAAVHAISECFQQEDVEAALFVDARNALTP